MTRVKPSERSRTFTVLPAADEVYRCYRCKRKIRKGERATITVRPPHSAEIRHAGRKCPATYAPSHPFMR